MKENPNLEAFRYPAPTRSEAAIWLFPAQELSLAAMFTGLPAHTSFCFVPLSPSRRTRSGPRSIPIPALSLHWDEESFLKRGATACSTWVLMVMAQAAARNSAPCR